jgi:RNA polymerase sigma-70 factor (ECF subfamily)
MRLIIEAPDGAGSFGISEDQPLPPEDRVPMARAPLRRTLDELYRSRGPRVLRFFVGRMGRQDAEDLLQDSFLRLSRVAAGGANDILCPEAYLTCVARNLLQDRAKSAFQRALPLHVPAEEISLAGLDPVAALEARDVLNRLNVAIMRLSPTTREVFMAHRLDGLSHAEIAERTGMSMASVARRMTKAIAKVDRVMRLR